PSGHVVVGSLQPAAHDTPRQPVTNQAPACFSNRPTGFDPGTSHLPTYTAADAITIKQVTRQIEAHTPNPLEYVPNAALVVAPNNTVRLCPANRSARQTVCTTGPRVTGIDA